MALLEVENLSIAFGGVKAVQGVSFRVEPGIIYSVIGPNGAGKTTLFNLLTGIYSPSEGDIRLEGASVLGLPPHELARRGMSRTFQNLQVCMNMTALENVSVPMELAGAPDAAHRAAEALRAVGLGLAGDLVVVALVWLAQVGGVGTGDGALGAHPVHGSAGVQAA